ncbi:acyltransferase [Aeromonas allosaccharophila]|uniref:acyltransferase n=1 Tax=Aeromonas allosaccharophila TaxID=656 RepID=UPI003D2282BD
MMKQDEYKQHFYDLTTFKDNPYHPLVWILGNPDIGENVFIGAFSEVNATGANVVIGAHCDIASFVTINCADSHLKCIELAKSIDRKDITLENNVFVGSHCVIKGGVYIGHHSVVAAGTIVDTGHIPPYSLVIGNPMIVKDGYYLKKIERNDPA